MSESSALSNQQQEQHSNNVQNESIDLIMSSPDFSFIPVADQEPPWIMADHAYLDQTNANEIILIKSSIAKLKESLHSKIENLDFTRKLADKADVVEVRILTQRVSEFLGDHVETIVNTPSINSMNDFAPSPTAFDALIKSHLKSIKREIRLEFQQEINILKEIAHKSPDTNHPLPETSRDGDVRLKNTVNKIQLQHHTLLAEIDDLKRQQISMSQRQESILIRIDRMQSTMEKLVTSQTLRVELCDIKSETARISKLDKRIKTLEQNIIKNNIGSSRGSDNETTRVLDTICEEIAQLNHKCIDLSSKKLDVVVMEELMRHIATRDEFKKLVKRVRTNAKAEDLAPVDSGIELEEIEKRLNAKLEKRLNAQLETRVTSLAHSLDDFAALEARLYKTIHQKIQTSVCQNIDQISQSICDIQNMIGPSIRGKLASREAIGSTLNEELYTQICREFDEKLYLVCTDLATCKSAWQLAQLHPFHRCGCWVWNGTKFKLGSGVPWNTENLNTDPDNFKWNENSSTIKVTQAGLYEISFAFFTKSKPSIQLIVNGESVCSAINSPSYVVHHGSGFIMDGEGRMEQGSVSGLSLIDFLALPAKSSIGLHFHGKRAGHGFMALRKLY